MELTARQAECLQVMETQQFVSLTTLDLDGCPSTRAMLNLRNRELYPHLVALYAEEPNPLTVYLTTNRSSAKLGGIGRDPQACLYYCEQERFHGVTLQGRVEIVTDNNLRHRAWQKGWEIYYPAGDDDYTLLRFVPDRLKIYSNFSVATEKL
ncbi:MAG: pyridoxamine 5'-phosphate oxidase family protein [Rikenellaceae bacterium]|jgi:general stress protein 26|nr:pyridoxamine 5'-phosphate oxidase family protein [Rikenellaceae bacterium]